MFLSVCRQTMAEQNYLGSVNSRLMMGKVVRGLQALTVETWKLKSFAYFIIEPSCTSDVLWL